MKRVWREKLANNPAIREGTLLEWLKDFRTKDMVEWFDTDFSGLGANINFDKIWKEKRLLAQEYLDKAEKFLITQKERHGIKKFLSLTGD